MTAAEVEDLIVSMRKQLAEDGEFNGPQTILERLIADGVRGAPSRATIARILARRGLVTSQPRKRPRSSYRRFQAARPNEMRQSDWTGWQLSNGKPVAIAGTLDDHSRRGDRRLATRREEVRDGRHFVARSIVAAEDISC